jgi:hypothetical protein
MLATATVHLERKRLREELSHPPISDVDHCNLAHPQWLAARRWSHPPISDVDHCNPAVDGFLMRSFSSTPALFARKSLFAQKPCRFAKVGVVVLLSELNID